jgi:uncharacterized protein YjbJ (UPF0337 family)
MILQKMNSLRLEADEAQSKVEELNGKVKTLEQENLTKEQEITSLQHKNQLLEAEVEKLEGHVKEHKDAAKDSAQHGTENESLQRKVQLLEEEAEENDKKLRETHEKYGSLRFSFLLLTLIDFVFSMSKQSITSERQKHYRLHPSSGSKSTRKWPRSIKMCSRIWRNSIDKFRTFKRDWMARL